MPRIPAVSRLKRTLATRATRFPVRRRRRWAVEFLEDRTLMTVAPTMTTLGASSNSVGFDQTVTLTANVSSLSSTPDLGTVTFLDGGVALGSPVSINSSGTAVLSDVALPVGTNVLTASYTGDGVNFDNSSSIGVGVNSFITTIAGNGNFAYSGDNGPATAAELYNSQGVATDSLGDVFIADTDNHRIREVNQETGVITTVAGNGTAGYAGDNGPATAAELDDPTGIAIDSVGNIFIADSQNNRIREINHATGDITTVAGNGTPADNGDGGQATSANLYDPQGIAVDSVGDLFIADLTNQQIREVNHATGIITTVAGFGAPGYSGDNGQATAAELDNPSGIAVDAAGDIFIADSQNNRIREVNHASGVITTVVGNGTRGSSGDNGPATAAELDNPGGVTVDSAGDLFIADTFDNRIREVNLATDTIVTLAGNGVSGYSGDQGSATASELDFPTGIALNSSGNLFVADAANNRIRAVNLATGVITTAAGDGGFGSSGDGGQATAAGLSFPTGVAVDSAGDLFIADSASNQIREVNSATGVITTVAGNGTAGFSGDNGPASAAELFSPTAIAIDAAGDLFITDTLNNRVREVNHATRIITTVAGDASFGFVGDNGQATAAELDNPQGIAVDSVGDLFIADSANNRIREVNHATGTITTVAGTGTATFGGDNGPATAAKLDDPVAVALDSVGDLFIADTIDNRIREVNHATGTITTVAGNGISGPGGDGGLATAAELVAPVGIAVDAVGDLFITDGSNRIREANYASGGIATVAGNGTAGFGGDNGPATAAEINVPAGIAVDAAGNLFIADTDNQRIREVAARNPVTVTVAGEDEFHAPSVTDTSTPENTQTSSGLVIMPAAQDTGFVTNFQITNITGGALFLNDGVSAITNGDLITVAQGAAGLKFMPSANSTAPGSFMVQESFNATPGGVGGSIVAATIYVNTATPPTSRVTTPSARTSLTSFTIGWTGTPGGGGPIAGYRISVSIDGGAYLPVNGLSDTTATSATYTAALGHTYSFMSQATDAAGDVEPAHTTADTTITTTATPWQYPGAPMNVSGSTNTTTITPLDALLVIDYLNEHTTGVLPPTQPAGSHYYDVIGNNDVEPLDALNIIDYLNTTAAVSPAVTSPPTAAGSSPATAGSSRAGAGVSPIAADSAVSVVGAEPAIITPAVSPGMAPALIAAPALPTAQASAVPLSPAIMFASLGGTAGNSQNNGAFGGGPALLPVAPQPGLNADSGLSPDNTSRPAGQSFAALASPSKVNAARIGVVDLLWADSTNWLDG